MKHIALLLAAALLTGCHEELATAPLSPAPDAAVSTEAVARARLAIDDALDRIVPSLGDATGARDIAAALGRLHASLEADRAAESPALTASALKRVERYAHLTGEDDAELDAIRLALQSVSAVQ